MSNQKALDIIKRLERRRDEAAKSLVAAQIEKGRLMVESDSLSIEHAVLSHRSFKDELLNDMLKHSNLTRSELVELSAKDSAEVAFKDVGHLQFLSFIECKNDRKVLRDICKRIRKVNHNYVIEPIEIPKSKDVLDLSNVTAEMFKGGKSNVPNQSFTISTTLTQDDSYIPFLVFVETKPDIYYVKIFHSKYMQFMSCQYHLNIVDNEAYQRLVLMNERSVISSQFKDEDEILMADMGLYALMTLLDLLDQPTEYIQQEYLACLLYTSPSPRDKRQSRMPSSA